MADLSAGFDPVGKFACYRLYDTADALLYVGSTANVVARLADHARTKDWWSEVARHALTWYASREDAEAAELLGMVEEMPLWNIRESPWRATAGPDGEMRATLKPEPAPTGSQHRFPNRNYRPDTELEYEPAKAAVEAAGHDMNRAVRACLRWIAKDPDVALGALAPFLDSVAATTPRGRPKAQPPAGGAD